ncbi:hypothetical protein K1719_004127 [Acacia pycnantha]|nr:hypothetical protein K1719_004127 [Acacia pycnantha]
MAEKVTKMRLNVDLQCEKCYKKVKKVLCKFPQIREQVVVPSRASKSCQAHPHHHHRQPRLQQPRLQPYLRHHHRVVFHAVKEGHRVVFHALKEGHRVVFHALKEGHHALKEGHRVVFHAVKEGQVGHATHQLQNLHPHHHQAPAPVPIGTCCVPCSEGRPGGPCFEGYCRPPPCYQGYFFARPVYDSYGGGRPCYVSRCDLYFNEDNATECTIM